MLHKNTKKKAIAFALSLSIVCTPAFAAAGRVNTGALRIRQEPSLGSEIIKMVGEDDTVTILGNSAITNEDGSWYKISYGEVVGYMSAEYLDLEGDGNAKVNAKGIVSATFLNLRAEASTDAEVLNVLEQGTEVKILSEVQDGWYEISYGDKIGFAKSEFLNTNGDKAAPTGDGAKYGVVNTSRVNFRADAGYDAEVLEIFVMNSSFPITGSVPGWYEVEYNGRKGYIRQEYLNITTASPTTETTTNSVDSDDDDSDETTTTTTTTTETPSTSQQPKTTQSNSSDSSETTTPKSSGSGTGNVISIAESKIGTPYVYGASGPNSFDCSGFTSYVYHQAGYSLSRTAAEQYRVNGTSVSKDSLKEGDLVFFRGTTGGSGISHVGIYQGGGTFIHAGSGSNGGRQVKKSSIYDSYYSSHYAGAKRIVN